MASEAPFRPMVDAQPIRRGEGDQGVLLLHGLSGTPYEVTCLADALHDAGYAVRAPLLAGHDSLDALERSTWQQWYQTALDAFEDLHADGRRRVAVLGFSMGSLLALRLAALRGHQMAGLVAISVPLHFDRLRRQAAMALARLRKIPRLHRFVGVLAKRDGPDVRIRREAEASPSLPAIPYPALVELFALQDEVSLLLPHVRVPVLLLHGRFDHTSRAEQSDEVAQRVSSERVELRILPHSFHVVGLDLDRPQLCQHVVEFVDSVMHAR